MSYAGQAKLIRSSPTNEKYTLQAHTVSGQRSTYHIFAVTNQPQQEQYQKRVLTDSSILS